MSLSHSEPRSHIDANSPFDESSDSPSNSAQSHGAPVEPTRPLGQELTFLSATNLNLDRILGSAIFSTPGPILNDFGSVGVSLLAWALAPVIALAQVMVYTEMAAMFPNRAGAEVVYLEQAYPNPRFLVPVSFAVTSILLSSSGMNAIVFAQYTLTAFNAPITSFSQSSLAIGVCAFCVLLVALSTKWSFKAVNAFSVVKVLSLLFIVLSGGAVLAGLTRIKDPIANLRAPFSDSSGNLNAIANGFIKTNLAFVGGTNAFNLITEVKTRNPVRVVSRAGYTSISITAALYFFTNLAYFCAIPKEEMAGSGQLVGVLFVEHVFGGVGPGAVLAQKVLPLMVAGSCLGNIIAVTIAYARILREIARQGLLPYPDFFASTRPFGTPIGPVTVQFVMTTFSILLLPFRDAFNFLLDFVAYPNFVFDIALILGVWILRDRRREAGLPLVSKCFKAWNPLISIYLLWATFLLIMPWVPPESRQGDTSFWYATYCVAGLGVLAVCGIYYYIWIVLLPRWGGYEVVETMEEQEGGVKFTKLVRRYKQSSGEEPEEQPLLS